MADIDDIATRIAGIILSPESVNGLINGAFTVPLDMGYRIYGVFDTGSRFRRETARIRMAGAIRKDILNYDHIIDAIKIIFTNFNIYVTETEQDSIYRAVLTGTLLIGGMTERSIRTSERLEAENPEIYNLLIPKDYYLLYFLFEPSVQPFVDAMHIRMTQGEPAFRKIIDLVRKEINA
ncbi:hypothetical protein ACE2AK_10625 [Rahnella perminowiae]|uniref:hypothetical protein n=1 Tax=Rahnella perminowiae TaxID=2816244 RepID=UPI00215CCE0C|nr:hypothetical protein [Rahnella perminowiae]MCR8998791.1 hypothetical protein [Rahnella perminowiae]